MDYSTFVIMLVGIVGVIGLTVIGTLVMRDTRYNREPQNEDAKPHVTRLYTWRVFAVNSDGREVTSFNVKAEWMDDYMDFYVGDVRVAGVCRPDTGLLVRAIRGEETA